MTAAFQRVTLSKLARPAAWAMAAIAVTAMALDLVIVLAVPAAIPSSDSTVVSSVASLIPWLPLAIVVTVLALRRPGNPAGWLLGSLLVFITISSVGSDYLYHWLYGHDLPRALVTPLALTSVSSGAAAFFGLTTLLLVFPDGHLLSRRWRGVVWLNIVLAALASVPPLFDPTSIGDGHRQLPNPLGVAGAHPLLSAVSTAAELATFAVAAIGIVSLVIRYRRAGAEVRQQIKWFGAGVVVLLVALIVGSVTTASQANWTAPIPLIAEVIGFSAVPLCIGVAVLKYRLYDLDVVISRTLVYGSLAALITGVYVGIAVGIGELVGSGGKPNLGLSILATAIVAVGFQPVRERVQRVANRHVYGKRATPYEVLAQFSERVAESYAADDVMPRMARVLAEGTGAQRADVWVRSAGTWHQAAVWPADAPRSEPVAAVDGTLPSTDGAGRLVAVRHQGDLLGALSVTKRSGEALTPVEENLLNHLAGQAGLVLKNVGLSSDLQRRLEELRASRQRLVTAQDEERRRLERNLHDGAQQHLVALKVKLGLAEMLIDRDAARALTTLAQLKGDADEALETLRDLARGIYPPLLAERGLGVALESQVRKATIPVTVEAEGIGRYSQDVEAAVYFSVLEALQNVQKYAHAAAASVRLRELGGELHFSVTDDGAGFDVATTARGSGLTNMADRLDALGGAVTVRSTPGEGTELSGRLPVYAEATPAADQASTSRSGLNSDLEMKEAAPAASA